MIQKDIESTVDSLVSELAILQYNLDSCDINSIPQINSQTKRGVEKILTALHEMWNTLGLSDGNIATIAKKVHTEPEGNLNEWGFQRNSNTKEVLVTVCKTCEIIRPMIHSLIGDYRVQIMFTKFLQNYEEALFCNGIRIHSLEIGETDIKKNWAEGRSTPSTIKSMDMRVESINTRAYEFDGEPIMKQNFTYFTFTGGHP